MKTGKYLFLIRGQYVLDNRCLNLFREYLGNKYFLMLRLLLFLVKWHLASSEVQPALWMLLHLSSQHGKQVSTLIILVLQMVKRNSGVP